jgi:hypothetical protein
VESIARNAAIATARSPTRGLIAVPG